ncbi:MAG TPA: hypothetical protein VNO14_13545, partial [Blastocatellia bacterium]|nr:hypothetical protein [Blastocatellia bacterium]
MLERLHLISVMSRLLALALIAAAAQPALSKQQRPRRVSRQPIGASWTIPADTVISLRLDRSLSSKTSRVGDRFTATVTIPVHVNGVEVIPAGSVVEGR